MIFILKQNLIKFKAKVDDSNKLKVLFKKIVLIVGCFLVLLFLVISSLIVNEVFGFVKRNMGDKKIEILKGSSITNIANVLKDNKIINSSFLFCNYVKLKKVKLKYGVFELNSAMSYDKIIQILLDDLKNGKFLGQLNFYEGSNFFSLKEKYSNFTNFSFVDLIAKLNDIEIYSKFNFFKLIKPSQLKNAFFPMEGFCSTRSFNIKDSYDVETVANLIFNEFDKMVEKFSDEIKNSEFDFWQLLTLASIIQGETSSVKYMPLISSVLHNRLHDKTYGRLESCVTRKYANCIANELKKQGLFDFKKADSYNTYKCFGLPAGPICNPGYEAFSAALNPAKSEYMYFCVDLNTKKIFFAKTFEEHKKNLILAHLV